MPGLYSADYIRQVVFGDQETALYEENVMAYRAAAGAVTRIQNEQTDLHYMLMNSAPGEDRERILEELDYWRGAHFVAQGLRKYSLGQAKNEARCIPDVSKRKELVKVVTARAFSYC